MKRIFAISFIVLFLLIGVAQSVAANWYAGDSIGSAYGVKATIALPSSGPTVYSGFQASWVSAGDGQYWAQTGWIHLYGYSNPWAFTEYVSTGGHDLQYRTQLYWGGAGGEYQVSYSGGGWFTYIYGNLQEIVYYGGIPTPPTTVDAYSEINGSSSNGLNTIFSGVQKMNSDNSWSLFNGNASWREDSPYYVNKWYYWYFGTVGP